jgi:RNA polymerase subunit RPABC4/transcription elongation factor Spt4
MLLHIDGSRHCWLQNERWYDLLVILDDATSEIYYAQLVEEESLRAFIALGQPTRTLLSRATVISHPKHSSIASTGGRQLGAKSRGDLNHPRNEKLPVNHHGDLCNGVL